MYKLVACTIYLVSLPVNCSYYKTVGCSVLHVATFKISSSV